MTDPFTPSVLLGDLTVTERYVLRRYRDGDDLELPHITEIDHAEEQLDKLNLIVAGDRRSKVAGEITRHGKALFSYDHMTPDQCGRKAQALLDRGDLTEDQKLECSVLQRMAKGMKEVEARDTALMTRDTAQK